MSVEQVYEYCPVSIRGSWCRSRHHQDEKKVKQLGLCRLDRDDVLFALKRKGFSDSRLAGLLGVREKELRKKRWELGVYPVYKRVDTCAAEFATSTAYMYSTYEEECEANPSEP
jgi:carbamoyl-phosphate synthase large subunit